MLPKAEIAHWLFAAGFLFFGLVLLAEALVGTEVFRRRAWRACLWPGLALFAGAWLWVIAIFSTFSTLHLLAHAVWAQAATAAGGVQLAVEGDHPVRAHLARGVAAFYELDLPAAAAALELVDSMEAGAPDGPRARDRTFPTSRAGPYAAIHTTRSGRGR